MRAVAVVALPLVMQAAGLAQEGSFPSLQKAVEQVVKELGLDGAGLVVWHDEAVLHRSTHGKISGDTVLPIGSASEWLAVATILALVDDKKIDLDVPVARYVKEFDRPDKRSVTLRQCLSCTAGLPARMSERMNNWDMEKFAREAAGAGLKDDPGSAFRYGAVSFQIAAVAAERATGKTWHELFAQKIAAPLGMTSTKFSRMQPPGGEAGTTTLPWVGSGAESTLDDYSRFVRMLVDRGEFDGKRVLSETSVTAMWRDQVQPNVTVRPVGFEARRVRYGLGTWIETPSAGAVRVTDAGTFGFTAWVDLDLGVGGVFAVRDHQRRVLEELGSVQDEVRRVALSPAVAGTSADRTLSHGGHNRRYEIHMPPNPEKRELPLLVVLHGDGSSGEPMRDTTGLAAAGVRAGFVVVFPEGSGSQSKRLSWNSGGVPVYAVEQDVDDVGFLKALVADVQKAAPIAAAHVYAVGYANGAMMCHRLAREASDLFAGIAAVAGDMTFTKVDAQRPLAVLLVHGSDDNVVRYAAPRPAAGKPSERVETGVAATAAYYVQRNGAPAEPQTKQDGKVRIDTYGDDPSKRVRVITLEGGNHAWPGARGKPATPADTPFAFDATQAIVAWFRDLAYPSRTTPQTPR